MLSECQTQGELYHSLFIKSFVSKYDLAIDVNAQYYTITDTPIDGLND